MATKNKITIEAEDRASEALKRIGSAAGGLESVLGEIGGQSAAFSFLSKLATPGAAAIAALGGVAAGTLKVVDSLDSLNEAAQGVGVTAVALSQLRAGAVTAGVGAEKLDGALNKLNNTMADAAAGGKESQAAFKALGISVLDGNGNLKATDAVLGEVADKFASYQDGAEKSALANKLMGKTGFEMVAFLNQGKDGLKVLTAVTDDNVKAAARLADDWDRVKQSMADASVKGFTPLISSLAQASKEMDVLKKNGANFWETIFQPGFGANDTSKERTQALIDEKVASIAKLEKQIRGLNGQNNGDPPQYIIDRSRALQQQVEVQQKELSNLNALRVSRGYLTEAEQKAADVEKAAQEQKGKAPIVKLDTGPSESQKAADAAIKSMDDQLAKLNEITNVEQVLKDVEAGRYKDATVDQQVLLLYSAQMLDDKKIEIEINKDLKKQAEERFKAEEAAAEAADAWVKSTQASVENLTGTGALRRYTEQVTALNLAYEGNVQGLEKITKAQKDAGLLKAKEDLDRATGAGAETRDILKDLNMTFTSAAEDALVNGKRFGDVFKGMEQDILRMVVRMQIIKPLMESIFGNGKGGSGFDFGSAMSSVGSFFGFGGGSVGAPHAMGGPVNAGTTYLVGERGPELFTASNAGNITPNHKLGGQSVVINQTVNVGAGASRTEVAQAMYAAKESAKAEVFESMRRGGAMAMH